MLSSYRALLKRSGARSLALACAISWLSFTGYVLAVILVVHRVSGSFAIAGAAVAVLSAGISVLAPVRGRLVDRHGARALVPLVVAHLAGGALLLVGCVDGYHPGLLFPGAALFGIAVPPIIGAVRTRWTLIAGPDLAHTGHALNSALADGASLASPGVVAALALLTSPQAALGLLIVGVLGAALLLSASGVALASAEAARPRLTGLFGVLGGSPGLRTLVVCDFLSGAWLMALDLVLTSIASSHGSPELAALPLASSALGGIATSLWAGRDAQTKPPASRYLIGLAITAAALAVTLADASIPVITLVLIPAGAGYGILNVAAFELLDVLSPPEHATEAFTWLTTASAAGGAGGSIVAGHLIETNAMSGLLLSVTLATAALTIALALKHTLKPTDRAG